MIIRRYIKRNFLFNKEFLYRFKIKFCLPYEEMTKYYENRPVRAPFTVRTVKGWSDHIQDHLERSILPNMLNHLNTQGYAKK